MFLTIFTPTYNRAYRIETLYNSLKKQTNKNFEWIVIDDGSTDNTEKLFDTFTKEDNGFKILYQKTENGGKHRAINKGVKLASGDLFFIVDSDDYITETAVSLIYKWIGGLDKNEKWAGVAGLKAYNEKQAVGATFSGEYVDATTIDRQKHNIDGDKSEVFFTALLKEFPFKEFIGEKFITEDTVWLKIAEAGYKIRWFNEIIYICEYLSDGLSSISSELRLKNPQGLLYTSKLYLDIFKRNFKKRNLTIYKYYVVGKAYGKSVKTISEELGISVFSVKFANFAVNLKAKIRKLLKGNK